MWLLNTATYKLEYVFQAKRYAILSHTWDKDEVDFHTIQDPDVASTKKGWQKIERTCRLAAAEGIQYAWIDTCCIDKSSSAELSEAINSMFRWYRESSVCYVWLSDFSASPGIAKESITDGPMSKCKWFQRGWTLQELIAPKKMDFFDGRWIRVGTKASLLQELSKITSIDGSILNHDTDLSTVPVAKRMAWAAGRETTRVEDRAYSLLGIFDVNMPMIYGEGEKAFLRLQEAIAVTTNDLSLFAWSACVLDHHRHGREYAKCRWFGIFANWPCQFASCLNLVNVHNPLNYHVRAFTIANRGLEFFACLGMDHTNGDYIMDLHCELRTIKTYRRRLDGKGYRCAIRLMKTPHGFVRYTTRTFEFEFDSEFELDSRLPFVWDLFPRSVKIPKHIPIAESQRIASQFRNAFRFWAKAPRGWSCQLTITDPQVILSQSDGRLSEPSFWDPCRNVFLTESHPDFVGMLYVCVSRAGSLPTPSTSASALLLCGFFPSTDPQSDSNPSPWLRLEQQDGWESPLEPTVKKYPNWGVHETKLRYLVQMRHQMHYSRFLNSVRQAVRTEMPHVLRSSISTYDSVFGLNSELQHAELGLTLKASLSAVGDGDKLTNDITITLEETRVERSRN
ncbi:Heterokaryon incompatibility protein (HET) domain containing protein [Rhypophila sp. PSN 637]